MTSATTTPVLPTRVTIAVSVRGSGPPIVLVHGLGGSSANWRGVLRLLPGRRVLIPDLPGHGDSPAPGAASTVDTFVDGLAEAIARETAEPALVVGHSFGGLLAARLASRSRPGCAASCSSRPPGFDELASPRGGTSH